MVRSLTRLRRVRDDIPDLDDIADINDIADIAEDVGTRESEFVETIL